MAFHVACPITCKRICFCTLGFHAKLLKDGGNGGFLAEIAKVEEFLGDPWFLRAREAGGTVQVPVPKVAPPVPPVVVSEGDGGGDGAEELGSAQAKRATLQKRAAVASMAAEDFARRFESGALLDSARDPSETEHGQSNVNVMCRLCFSGENEGSERAKRMLSCRSCGKKYHRGCLKVWSQHRDLFHWSSWTCPSCRICEACRRTGDPNKFKFCKRCDGAYHCYCMQPPHKNVSYGPFLCPKHTKCHSCGSKVPGNGSSLRWFLGYTCCDACGRLFTKGNYCPVCLKVYRDSEATPMVCCDHCQRWVHCQCDGISDEQYAKFQSDDNLPYNCPPCRGKCYQVMDLEDAVRELWRRRDEADRDLIASLRAAAGLPTEDEMFSLSPFSDDEDNSPFAVKNERGGVKLSFKSAADSFPKNTKESGKKSSSKKHTKKKEYRPPTDGKKEVNQISDEHRDAQSFGSTLRDDKASSLSRRDGQNMVSSQTAGSLSPTDRVCSVNQPGVLKHRFVDEISGTNEVRRPRSIHFKSQRPKDAGLNDDVGKRSSKSKVVKGTKLVIHLGGRNKNITGSPRSDSSSYQRDQDSTVLNAGSEAMSQQKTNDGQALDTPDGTASFNDVNIAHETRGIKRTREGEGNLIKLGKGKSESPDITPKPHREKGADGNEQFAEESPVSVKRTDDEKSRGPSVIQTYVSKSNKISLRKHPESKTESPSESNKNNSNLPRASNATPKESKPLLKLKFKTPYPGLWGPQGEEEKGFAKGQRSKRKRPLPMGEKAKHHDEEDGTGAQDENLMNEMMDANWVLRKLGKDAIGKRVEVHQPSDDSWIPGFQDGNIFRLGVFENSLSSTRKGHKGLVSDIDEGTSILSVDLDDGRSKTLELGKQGIRFVPHKQKRSKS